MKARDYPNKLLFICEGNMCDDQYIDLSIVLWLK